MKTAIVFEDDRRTADYVGEILHDVGMDVTHSDCHEDSIPLFPIDLAVCDLSHHNREVFESLREFRREHLESRIIAIVDPNQTIHGVHRDDGILEKPFNAAELLVVINDLERVISISHAG